MKSIEEKIISFFSRVSDVPLPELSEIKKVFKPRSIKKNDYFIKAGEFPHKFGLNISGLFRYFYIDKDGKEYTKYFTFENDLLISYSAILLGEKSKFYIQALDNSEILVADYSQFSELVKNMPFWDKIGRKLIERQYIKKEKREYQFLFEDAETRYKQFLIEYPQLIDKVKHYYIASYLGISPVSLSRIRKKYKNNSY